MQQLKFFGQDYLAHQYWVRENDVVERTQASACIHYLLMTMSHLGIVRTKVIKSIISTQLALPTLKKITPNAQKI